jgi:hypothetical protein
MPADRSTLELTSLDLCGDCVFSEDIYSLPKPEFAGIKGLRSTGLHIFMAEGRLRFRGRENNQFQNCLDVVQHLVEPVDM